MEQSQHPAQTEMAEHPLDERCDSEVITKLFGKEELRKYVEDGPDIFDSSNPFLFGNLRLSLPIHQLFLPFRGYLTHLPDLGHALCLATRYITSPATLPFFHNLITAPLTPLPAESAYYNVPFYHLPKSPYAETGLPQAEHVLTLRVLNALTSHVRLVEREEPAHSYSWAITEVDAAKDRPTPARLEWLLQQHDSNPTTPSLIQANNKPILVDESRLLTSLGFAGDNATMILNPKLLEAFHPSNSPRVRVRAAFFVATVLVHELAHAIWICRVPDPAPPPEIPPSPYYEDQVGSSFNQNCPSEPFHANDRACELGRACESSMFAPGGHLFTINILHGFDSGIAWTRWGGKPADELVADPVGGPHASPILLARLITPAPSADNPHPRPRPRQAPRWSTIYAIPDSWLHRQFFSQFWDTLSRLGMRCGVLAVPRVLGVRSINHEWIDPRSRPVSHRGSESDGWPKSCSSRDRGAVPLPNIDPALATRGEGVVRLGQQWVDLSDSGEDSASASAPAVSVSASASSPWLLTMPFNPSSNDFQENA